MISRIFFPIGQGAFYAERHNNFNIVYDCGNWRQTKSSKSVVSQSFNKNESIKILFISHLDWDHISLLEILKNTVSSIDYVILPLLHDEQKILISNIHKVLGYSSSSIINNPQVFFGDKVKIIYIKPSENDVINDGTIVLDRDDNLDSEIESGTRISINSDYNWCFIPFNIKNNERNKILEKKLEKKGFDVTKLKTDSDYIINNLLDEEKKDNMKDIYNSLTGKINENSLVIYSGPKFGCVNCGSTKCLCHMYSYCEYICSNHYIKIGCIYTGDTNLNKFNLINTYQHYWSMVGTVQIPHHGSIEDFNSDFLNSNDLICPISFSINNNYGHPSYKVINDIISKNSQIIKVTEKMDSGYIQRLNDECIFCSCHEI